MRKAILIRSDMRKAILAAVAAATPLILAGHPVLAQSAYWQGAQAGFNAAIEMQAYHDLAQHQIDADRALRASIDADQAAKDAADHQAYLDEMQREQQTQVQLDVDQVEINHALDEDRHEEDAIFQQNMNAALHQPQSLESANTVIPAPQKTQPFDFGKAMMAQINREVDSNDVAKYGAVNPGQPISPYGMIPDPHQ
jgi:hypothetical protein